VGAASLAYENSQKHLLTAQRVEDWDFNVPASPLPAIPSDVFEVLRNSLGTKKKRLTVVRR